MSSNQARNEVHHWKTLSSNTIAHCHVAINRHFLPHSVPTFLPQCGLDASQSLGDTALQQSRSQWRASLKGWWLPEQCNHSQLQTKTTTSPFNKNYDCWQTQLRSHESRVLLFHGVCHWRVLISHTIASMQLSLDHEWRLYRMIIQPNETIAVPKLRSCGAVL